jgi:hypothetical protein
VAQVLVQGGGHGFVRLARQDEGADFLVSIAARDCYQIQDPAGAPLPNLPPLSSRRGEAQAQPLVDLLAHLAKFRNVQRLVNRDRQSPLRAALLVDAGCPPEGWELGQPTDFTKATPMRRALSGEWIWMKLANMTNQELSVGVLDLQPDWGISLILPQCGDSVTLEPGSERVLTLQVNLPIELEQGTDLLKVIAVTGRIDFRWLELPALDSFSLHFRSWMRGGPRLPSDELEALFAALTAESEPKRSRQPSRNPEREWATAHLEIHLKQSHV